MSWIEDASVFDGPLPPKEKAAGPRVLNQGAPAVEASRTEEAQSEALSHAQQAQETAAVQTTEAAAASHQAKPTQPEVQRC
jgi:hypothetical protein